MKHLPALALLAGVSLASAADTSLPHLRRQGTATQLVVDGQPFLIRGGELGNSSGEPGYLRPFWPKLAALKLNTVLVPVYWDVIEPEEGRFDYTTVDGLLTDARANGMRLLLLWFGSWKNSMSCYVPAWVKRDMARFPRSRDGSGRSQEILSPFAGANRDTDARAFAALMRHLREADGAQHTVILVQVENEIGMIPDARDHSAEADALFAAAVPKGLLGYLAEYAATLAPELRALWDAAGARTSGTWTEVFGAGPPAEEVFMAWHFARYTQAVAAAGKAQHALPLYVNAALIRPGYQPGQYPSAGPLPHLIDVWRAGAPAIDFIAPDIYFPTFVEWARRYTRSGNPLFIPEALRGPDAAANALYAFGALDAIGFCPFAIESTPEPGASMLAAVNDLIAQLAPILVEQQGRGTTAGLLPESADNRAPQQLRLGGSIFNATFERAAPPSLADGGIASASSGPGGAASLPAGGLIIATAQDEFIVAGIGVTLTFASLNPGEQAGILNVEEGRFADGLWQHVRWLNGDQTHQGRHLRLEPGRFTIQRLRLYRYR
jgi:beta-galactosidase GanA